MDLIRLFIGPMAVRKPLPHGLAYVAVFPADKSRRGALVPLRLVLDLFCGEIAVKNRPQKRYHLRLQFLPVKHA
jgi:hypothetical protein